MADITYKDAPIYDVISVEIDDNPSDFGKIDYDVMFEKQFFKPLGRITEAVWGEGSWDELMTGLFTADMDEFF